MANKDIVDYIKQARDIGDSDNQIKSDLISIGWNKKEVSDAFAATPNLKPVALEDLKRSKVQRSAEPEKAKQQITKQDLSKEFEPKNLLKSAFRVILLLASLIFGFIGIMIMFLFNNWLGRAILLLSIIGLAYGVYDSWHDTSKLKYLNIAVKFIVGVIYLIILVSSFAI